MSCDRYRLSNPKRAFYQERDWQAGSQAKQRNLTLTMYVYFLNRVETEVVAWAINKKEQPSKKEKTLPSEFFSGCAAHKPRTSSSAYAHWSWCRKRLEGVVSTHRSRPCLSVLKLSCTRSCKKKTSKRKNFEKLGHQHNGVEAVLGFGVGVPVYSKPKLQHVLVCEPASHTGLDVPVFLNFVV